MKYSEVQKFRTRLENLGGRYWSKYTEKRIYFSPAKAFEIAGGGYSNDGAIGSGWLPGWGTLAPFDTDRLETVFFDFRDDTWKSKGSADVSELIVALTMKFGIYPNPQAYEEYEFDEKEAEALAAYEERLALSRRHDVFATRSIAKVALAKVFPEVRFTTNADIPFSCSGSHGAIKISWADGPALEEVAAVVRPYIGTARKKENGKREKVEVPVASKDTETHFYDVSTFHLYRSDITAGKTYCSKVEISLADGIEPVISPAELLPETPPKPISQAALKRAAAEAKAKELKDAFDLAASEDASQEDFAGLVDHVNSRVREALAKNPRVGSDILADIVRNSQHVRVALGSNPNTPIEELRELMIDVQSSVRIAVFHNPSITPDMLNDFARDPSFVIPIEMMSRENVNPEHWAIWAAHWRVEVREFLAKSPSAPLDILHWIALNDRNRYISDTAHLSYEKRVAQGERLSE